jgi:N-acetylglucosaminyldiphosphoundecaprenol N-acetyl-beta-D-mannosaminyltransferase
MALSPVSLFGIALHPITMSDALAVVRDWMLEDQPCRYVVTPNVDHIVMLQSNSAMQAAYRNAALVVADGWPLVAASRLLSRPLPERVAGSDLVPGLLSTGQSIPGFRVFLLGAAPGVGEKAAERIHSQWPGVTVSGVCSPPQGFERDSAECARLVEAINAVSPHLVVVSLGAAKQEIWLDRHAPALNARVAIGAGATIDFIAGVQRRAPRLVQRLRMEWLFRMALEPRRLAGRYLRDAIEFPIIVAAEWRKLRRERA